MWDVTLSSHKDIECFEKLELIVGLLILQAQKRKQCGWLLLSETWVLLTCRTTDSTEDSCGRWVTERATHFFRWSLVADKFIRLRATTDFFCVCQCTNCTMYVVCNSNSYSIRPKKNRTLAFPRSQTISSLTKFIQKITNIYVFK